MIVSPAILREALGERFLCYALALTEESLIEWVSSGSSDRLEPRQRNALEYLDLILSTFPSETLENEYQRHFQLSDVLGRFVPDQDCTIAVAIRSIASGGDSRQRDPSGDLVLDNLVRLASDLYPLLLLPRPEQYISVVPGAAAFSHPARAEFEKAVLADSELATLFRHHSTEGGHVGYVFSSTGHGGSTQLWMLSSQLVASSWVLASASSPSDPPTVEDLLDSVRLSLSTLRKAVLGQRCLIPVRIGFAGVVLSNDDAIQLPWGRIRSRSTGDETLIPSHLDGKLIGQTHSGEEVTIDYRGDLTLDTEIELVLKVSDWDPQNMSWPSGLPATNTRLQEIIENCQLALMISDQERLTLVVPTWTHQFDPLSNQGFFSPSRSQSQSTQLRPQTVEAAQAEAWASISAQLDAIPSGRIAVTRRRILQAAAERRDPNDVLVDAVIAWESMVGADSETVFRVSGAMAWLLEPSDTKARAALQREIKKIYGLRSSVVHGSGELSQADSATAPSRALELACGSILRLVTERGDLLQYKNVAERSNLLIMGR